MSTPPQPSLPGAFSDWLRRGQECEAKGDFGDAVACYNLAGAELLDPAGNDRQAFSVVCMNRGSALRQIGDMESLHSALAAYDEAIAIQREALPAADLLASNSLAAALLNRGQLLHQLHGKERGADALASLDEAISILRPLLAAPNAAPRRNLAGTLVNRANLQLDLGLHAKGAASARDALLLVTVSERASPADANLALLARRALCDSLGQMLALPGADEDALASEASDVVDEALALVRHWAARGATGYDALAARLFLFGARLYRFHQPHFLPEFLLEHLEAVATPELVAVAREAIADALADAQRPRLLLAGTPEAGKLLDLVHVLRAAETRLGPGRPS